MRLAGKLDTTGLWNGLRLWGTEQIPAPYRTLVFAGGVAALAARNRPRLILCGHVNFAPVAHALHWGLGIPYVVLAFGVEVGPHLPPSRARALRSAAEVWAISRWTAERVRAAGVADERIRILPVTLREDSFDLSRASAPLRARLGIATGERVILTVGRLDSGERYKGYDNVLQALPQVLRAAGPVRYVIVGGGNDVPRLKLLAQQTGVGEHVTFAGFVADTELADYYRLADAFAMPSVGEGFGIVYLEALASGVPVLGGNRDGTVDALADGELGLLVDPLSIDAIADGLVQLLAQKGHALWFQPSALRRRCLDLYGREAFRSRAQAAIQPFVSPVSNQQ